MGCWGSRVVGRWWGWWVGGMVGSRNPISHTRGSAQRSMMKSKGFSTKGSLSVARSFWVIVGHRKFRFFCQARGYDAIWGVFLGLVGETRFFT